MPLENVARIEVIRGPGSALYGADAFSGVINVITKTAADIDGTELGARAGSFNSRDAWVLHGGKLGKLDAAFYLSAGNTDGQKGIIKNDAQSAWDSTSAHHTGYTPVSLAPGPINVNARESMRAPICPMKHGASGRLIRKEKWASARVPPGAWIPTGAGTTSKLYLDMSYEKANWAPNWDVSGVPGYYNIKENGRTAFTLFPAGAFGGAFPNGMIGNPGHSERHTHASVSAFYTGFEQHRVRIGAGLPY